MRPSRSTGLGAPIPGCSLFSPPCPGQGLEPAASISPGNVVDISGSAETVIGHSRAGGHSALSQTLGVLTLVTCGYL